MKSPLINKIIVTTNEWYTNEKFKRNGILEMLREGYEVELWNEAAFCYEKIPKMPKDLYRGNVITKNFETKKEFQKALTKLGSDALLLCYYSDYSDMVSVCNARIKYCNIFGAAFLAEPWLSNIDYYYNKITLKRIKQTIIDYIHSLQHVFHIRNNGILEWKPIYNFITSPADYFPSARTTSRESLRFIHTYDYDHYLRDPDKNLNDHGYILFIDEALGIHPEEVVANIHHSDSDIQNYRRALQTLFNELENQTEKKVIIAAHPKAEYKGNEFGKREIIQFRTYDLLKHCSFFIQHWSTVSNLGIFFKKPMLITYSDVVDKEYSGTTWRKLLKKYFNCKLFNLNKDKNPFSYVFFDNNKYDQYVHDFCGYNPDDRRLNIEIILDEIAKIK